MLSSLIEASIRHRALILLAACLLALAGGWAASVLPLDAVPDVTPNQVQVNTAAPGWSPAELEYQVTYPIEVAMGNLPRVQAVRSLSMYGLSQVTVIFDDAVDTYFARQLVFERLQEALRLLPPGMAPALGPVTTGLGEIFGWIVRGKGRSLMELRTLQDWAIRPRLLTVPGLAEVNAWGGSEQQVQVLLDPRRMVARGLTVRQVADALARSNTNVSAGYVEHADEQYLVRGVGRFRSASDVRRAVLAAPGGHPVYVADVAEVRDGPDLATSAATRDGREEVVIGIAMLLKGSNSRTVVADVRRRLDEIGRSLPRGVEIQPFYDRADLINATVHTVFRNLAEGGALVAAVLLLLLGNARAALVVAAVIPLSMLGAVVGMLSLGVSGNLMSLGAIDFGLIVDGAIVMAENAVRRLREVRRQNSGAPLERAVIAAAVGEAAREVAAPTAIGVLIVTLVYVPLFALEGVEARMFRPMAATVMLALAASLVLAFTWVPAAVATVMSGRIHDHEPVWVDRLRDAYDRLLQRARRLRVPLVLAAVLAVAAGAWLFSELGAEFLPRFNEGAVSLEVRRLPGVALPEAVRTSMRLEQALGAFPEVKTVTTRSGSPEVATDPMGPEASDVWVILKPRSEWPERISPEALVSRMARAAAAVPGLSFGFSQPIEQRFNEIISGTRSDVAVRVLGPDLGILRDLSGQVERVLRQIPGAADVRPEATSGVPMVDVRVRRGDAARYGLDPTEVMETLQAAVGGIPASVVLERERRFPLQVRFPEGIRRDPRTLAGLLVGLPGGGRVTLGEVADVAVGEGPLLIAREHGERRAVVQANVRGRDLAGFVEDARRAVEREVKLPQGYYVEWSGQFENLDRARRRLGILVPTVLVLILAALLARFGSLKQSLLVFTGVPFAVTGGVLALWLRGLPFSISAGVGFIALSGVAVLNGVVMVSYINQLRAAGAAVSEAVLRGAAVRLRPVLTTALVASLGFIPMALASGTGAEVQRPLATVVIGGLVTSTLLTLLIVPLAYEWMEGGKATA